MLISLVLGLFAPAETVCAAAGSASVSVSSGSVNIGDSVTVTVKASGASGEKAYATMTLSYDAGILQFVSCSTTYGGGGGSVTAATDSFTVTFQAVAAGTSSLSVSATDGVVYDTNEELDSMSGSSASVTVNNAAGGGTGTGNGGGTGTGTPGGGSGGGTGSTGTANLSADNSLKSLTISPGTLSPAFTGKTTKYSAAVGNEVTNIAVTATPANEKAVVESVTGNSNLAVGSNTVKVVVKAENGVTATYTIVVTRQGTDGAEEPQDPDQEEPDPEDGEDTVNVTVNGISYHTAGSFAAEDIPVDFSETVVDYHGQECKGVRFDKGSIVMLYLVPETAEEEEKQGSFFVFDEVRDTLYPFVKLDHGEKYMIALLAPVDFVMPENFIQTEIKIDGENTVTAFQKMEEESEIVSDFYFIYGVNQDGTESWYRYDDLEGTYQRCNIEEPEESEDEEDIDMEYLQTEYAALSEKYREEKAFARNVIGILVFVIAVLVIIIINMLIFGQRRKKGSHDDDDLDDDITDFNDL